jgi:2-dehydropantoate 2-reductase
MLAALLQEAAIVTSFQNGLRNAEVLRRALPRQIVLAGKVPFNVGHRGEGRFHRASAKELMVERAPPALSRASFAGRAAPGRAQRHAGRPLAKLLLNLNNPINALSDLPLREEVTCRDYRGCLALVQREALRALDAAASPPRGSRRCPARGWIPPLLELPDALFRALALAARMLAIDRFGSLLHVGGWHYVQNLALQLASLALPLIVIGMLSAAEKRLFLHDMAEAPFPI